MKIAINGFGHIGRQVLRICLVDPESPEIVHVNDVAEAATLAHLLKYDSTLGVWNREVIAFIAASQYPEPAVVRMSDFKTNEYADLVGGAQFESQEENAMLGFRGVSRYHSDDYRDGFDLECRAIKRFN